MNRKILVLALALIVALGVVAAGCGEEETTTTAAAATTTTAAMTDTTAAAATTTTAAMTDTTAAMTETIKLTFSDHNPPGNAVAEATIAYGNYIAENSGGRVEVDTQVGGALYSNQEIFDGLVTGGADAGAYVPDDGDGLYYNTVCNLPFINYADDREAATVFWTLWSEFPELKKEYTDLGLVLTTTYVMPPMQMHWYATDVVVTTPADLQGKTLITLESYLADWLRTLGASAEQPAFPDLFPMIDSQTGDGVCLHFNFLGGFDLIPALKSHTVFGGGGVNRGQIGIVWNADSFNSLPADVQQVALDGQAFYLDTVIPGSETDYKKAMDAVAADPEQSVTELTPEQVAVFREALSSVYQEWVDGAPDPAVAQKMVDRLLELTQ